MSNLDTSGANDEQVTELLDLLRRTVRVFQQRLYDELKEYDLSISQMWVLRTLATDGIHSLAELSKKVDMSTSNVSGIVDRLVRMGLISRNRDESDRRVVWLKLTEKGEALTKKVPALKQDYFSSLLNKMGKDDTEALLEHLRKLVHVVESDSSNTTEV